MPAIFEPLMRLRPKRLDDRLSLAKYHLYDKRLPPQWTDSFNIFKSHTIVIEITYMLFSIGLKKENNCLK